jgi:hypothetical protein
MKEAKPASVVRLSSWRAFRKRLRECGGTSFPLVWECQREGSSISSSKLSGIMCELRWRSLCGPRNDSQQIWCRNQGIYMQRCSVLIAQVSKEWRFIPLNSEEGNNLRERRGTRHASPVRCGDSRRHYAQRLHVFITYAGSQVCAGAW